MKNKSLLLIIICVFISTIIKSQVADNKIAELINKGDYFELGRQYPQLKNEMKIPVLKLMSESLLNSFFNMPKEACNSIDELLINHQSEIGIETTFSMIYFLGHNMMELGKYSEIVELFNNYITQLSPYYSKEDLSQFYVIISKAEIYKKLPEHKVIMPNHDVNININIKKVSDGNLIFIPVEVNGKKTEFIFDTGSSSNYVSESFANKHNIRIMEDSVLIAGIGGQGYARIGIADSITIGDIVYYNPVFSVAAPNPEIDTIFKVDAVLGLDFMKKIGEFQIIPAKKNIIFCKNKTKTPAYGKNLMIKFNQIYAEGVYNNEKIVFLFDTGNSTADLYSSFYKKNKTWVEKVGKKEIASFGGYGGINNIKAFLIPSFRFKIGDKNCTIKNVIVNTEKKNLEQNNENGALGMDFILSCKKVIINLDQMFLIVE